MDKPEVSGVVDVVEMFGGESGVGKLCLRRRLKRGANFDLVTGFDLTDQTSQEEVMRYIRKHKPLMVILAPPHAPPLAIGPILTNTSTQRRGAGRATWASVLLSLVPW